MTPLFTPVIFCETVPLKGQFKQRKSRQLKQYVAQVFRASPQMERRSQPVDFMVPLEMAEVWGLQPSEEPYGLQVFKEPYGPKMAQEPQEEYLDQVYKLYI